MMVGEWRYYLAKLQHVNELKYECEYVFENVGAINSLFFFICLSDRLQTRRVSFLLFSNDVIDWIAIRLATYTYICMHTSTAA